jgi:hypothetical protein
MVAISDPNTTTKERMIVRQHTSRKTNKEQTTLGRENQFLLLAVKISKTIGLLILTTYVQNYK